MSLITYDEFIEKAKASRSRMLASPVGCEADSILALRGREDVFIAEWIVGGEEGHSCWTWNGEDPDNPGYPRDVAAEGEPDIFEVAPVLSDLGLSDGDTYVLEWDWVSIINPAYEVRGDYGNHLKYGVKWIAFDRLFEALVEIGKAEPRAEAPTP